MLELPIHQSIRQGRRQCEKIQLKAYQIKELDVVHNSYDVMVRPQLFVLVNDDRKAFINFIHLESSN